MNKKATNLTMNKLIIIILVILVILAILMFVFKVDILEWLRNLPGYSYDETDKEIDLTKLTDQQRKDLCPVEIGHINSVKSWVGLASSDYIFLNEKQTNLLWFKDRIELDEKRNEDVGKVESGKISIIKDWFIPENLAKHPKMPSLYELRLLDGAYRLPGNYICRLREIIELKKGDVIDLNAPPSGLKLIRDGELKTFSDDYGNEILVKKDNGEIYKLINKDNQEIQNILVEK